MIEAPLVDDNLFDARLDYFALIKLVNYNKETREISMPEADTGSSKIIGTMF